MVLDQDPSGKSVLGSCLHLGLGKGEEASGKQRWGLAKSFEGWVSTAPRASAGPGCFSHGKILLTLSGVWWAAPHSAGDSAGPWETPVFPKEPVSAPKWPPSAVLLQPLPLLLRRRGRRSKETRARGASRRSAAPQARSSGPPGAPPKTGIAEAGQEASGPGRGPGGAGSRPAAS